MPSSGSVHPLGADNNPLGNNGQLLAMDVESQSDAPLVGQKEDPAEATMVAEGRKEGKRGLSRSNTSKTTRRDKQPLRKTQSLKKGRTRKLDRQTSGTGLKRSVTSRVGMATRSDILLEQFVGSVLQVCQPSVHGVSCGSRAVVVHWPAGFYP